jgi:flagellar secretion chaperone FliS
MTMNAAYHKLGAYKQAAHTVSKTRQIVMLYDGAIRFLQQAKLAMQEGRIEERYHLLTKASNIMTGLQGCLDFEQDAATATTLYDFYAAREMEIFALHRTNSVQDCEGVIATLKSMREAWNAIDMQEGGGDASAEASNSDAESSHDNSATPYATSDNASNALSALMVSA